MVAPKSLPNGGIESRLSESAPAVSSRTRRLGLGAASIGFSLATTALLLKPARPEAGSTPLGDFRGFFAFDQLSYAAIATTAATGDLSRVEPFTQTGVSYYPSLWYQFLGLIARSLDIGVPATWTLLGSAVVALMVLSVGLVAISVSGRAWTAALVGPALWIGPIAMVFLDTWFLPLDSHAKLWGPYGLLFPLNAEAVGICLAALSIGSAAWASVTVSRNLQRIVIFSLSAIVLGLLANIHTYAFLISLTLVLAWLAVLGLSRLDRRARLIAVGFSLGIVVAVSAIAQVLTDMNGSIFLFGFMALAALPGIASIVIRHKRISALLGLLFLVGAAPQLVHLGTGLSGGDPFLEYRQVQSALLAVPLLPFIAASAPIGAWIGALIVLRKSVSIPVPLEAMVWASAITIPILTFNGYWGFAQEPYRMWIGSVALSSILLVIPTAYVATKCPVSGIRGGLRGAVALAAAVLITFSWWNLGGFRQFVQESGMITFGSERLSALKVLTEDLEGLLAADLCVDLQELKIVSRGRVAYYNPGLAWPDNKLAIDAFLTERSNNSISLASLQQANIDFLITADACEVNLKSSALWGLTEVNRVRYAGPDGERSFSAWRVLY